MLCQTHVHILLPKKRVSGRERIKKELERERDSMHAFGQKERREKETEMVIIRCNSVLFYQ